MVAILDLTHFQIVFPGQNLGKLFFPDSNMLKTIEKLLQQFCWNSMTLFIIITIIKF